ncbi:hypothetical protein LPH44_12035 (plasmid) [Xylella taiwanensis]|uniref:ATP-grasp domain-containing protein n=1 Tax=Xylella taiwanensis TaxID=1444770 RepID=A0ABS8TVN1_9GAMM|nr:hypothetical protein [Xylella taiwanensis]MCD8459795.1 hypothetical protein [Xylella taiwanensis]MCD8474185.1 hypothetical protein [Xylella taiwanensis]UFN08024.1 hypothetical protein LPH42_12055 [Xylella taiwanensis]UFN10317.1 hypothetical protein LPH45_12060 [Xylella taiwanensis]UFN12605.1 hypothetical protein LPH44_12035 [Xylella taiwanensis]
MITIVSSNFDLHAAAIVWSLNKAGIPAAIAETFFGLDQHGGDFMLCEADPIDLGQCRLGQDDKGTGLTYFRSEYTPRVDVDDSDEDFVFMRREKALYQTWLLQAIEDEPLRRFVNKPSQAIRADNKIIQLRAARRSGFAIPPTYFGAHSEQVSDMFQTRQSIVVKPLEPFTWRYADGRTKYAFAARSDVTAINKSYEKRLMPAPAIFQAEILKEQDIRALVFGEEIHAFRITQTSGHLDFREDLSDPGVTSIEYMDLPTRITDQVFDLMRRMNIDVACMDIVPDLEGNFHFLDLNPSGNWLFLEAHAPESLLSRFCTYLALQAGAALQADPPSYVDYKNSIEFAQWRSELKSKGAPYTSSQRNDIWVEK